jgi:NADH:ubiquinone oxidoreductase subunit C
MESSAVIEILQSAVPGAAYEVGPSVDMPTIYVPAEHLVATCGVLRDLPTLQFNVLIEVTAADYLPHEPRYEVVYHLLSVPNRQRLRV